MNGFLNIPGAGSPSWKAPVTNFASLPPSGNQPGDVRVTLDTFSTYTWNGSSWLISSGGNAFGIIQTPFGTFPVADGHTDSLTFTSLDSSVVITGDATTDSVDFSVVIPPSGISSINTDTTAAQTLTVGTSGSDFNIVDDLAGNHEFNLPTSSAINRGALSSADWSTFNSKEPAITAGLVTDYWRGDKTFQTLNTTVVPEGTNLYYTTARFNTDFATKTTTDLAEGLNLYYTAARFNSAFAAKTTSDLTEGSNLYFTDARARLAISGTAPVSYNNISGVISMHVSDASHDGYLSSTDWSTFNNKQSALTPGTISTATVGINIGGGSNSTVGPNVTIDIQSATGAQNGLLISSDWTTFNNKQNALTFGNLTDVGTDGITIGSGTGAVIGSGTTISQHVSDATHNGYLSSTDWSTFNSKQAAGSYITALTGDATATGPGSVALTLATVNGNVGSFGTATQVSTFTVNAKGLITAASNTSIQIAESQVTNLTTDLAGKVPTTRLINTTSPLTGGGDLSADRTIAIPAANGSTNGYLSSADWTTFNNKQASGNYITALTGDLTASGPGSVAGTLATVNSNIGTFGSSTSIPTFTVNGKGLITAASGNVVIAPAGTLTGTTLNSTVVTSSLTSVGTITSGTWTGTTIAIANGGTGASTTSQNFAFIGPTSGSGAPSFRALVAGDIPSLSYINWAFGDGVDGDVSISSGTTTLARDMYYNNLTISSTGKISTNGYRIFVAGTLDLTAAGASAINWNGNSGTAATGTLTGQIGGVKLTSQTIGGNTNNAPTGANGSTNAGGTGTNGTAETNGQGGPGGAGGNGGHGASVNGGTGGTGASSTNLRQLISRYFLDLIRGVALMTGGNPGGAGGGGSGNGANAGGGAGGAGCGGGIIYIAANIIKTNGAAASSISSIGGNGANSSNSLAATGGGGGGSGGGGGGQIYILYATKSDAAATNVIDASGGSGGAGGNGTNLAGGGTGGNGGQGGGGGAISLFKMTDGTGSETYGGTVVTANAASGLTGGASVSGQSTKVSF